MTTPEQVRQAVAETLYDELTGRHTGEDGLNSALRPAVTRFGSAQTDQETETEALAIQAMQLGLELHRSVGDRWALAQRLADKVLEAIKGEEAK